MASNGILEMKQIGYLADNPDFKVLDGGKKVASFVVITNETWSDKNTGEKKERAESFRYEVWDESADNLNDIVKKGHRIYVESEPRNNVYTDDKGVKVYGYRFVVTKWITLEKKSKD
jgi:single-strand DNA-binding protein